MNRQQFDNSRTVLEQLVHTHAPATSAATMLHHIRQMADAMAQEEAVATTRLQNSRTSNKASTLRRFILGEVRCDA